VKTRMLEHGERVPIALGF